MMTNDTPCLSSGGYTKTYRDIEFELSEESAVIAKLALPYGEDFLKAQPLSGLSKKDRKQRRELKKKLYQHMLDNYKAPQGSLFTIIAMFFIRQVLWWLAEKLLKNFLDWND